MNRSADMGWSDSVSEPVGGGRCHRRTRHLLNRQRSSSSPEPTAHTTSRPARCTHRKDIHSAMAPRQTWPEGVRSRRAPQGKRRGRPLGTACETASQSAWQEVPRPQHQSGSHGVVRASHRQLCRPQRGGSSQNDVSTAAPLGWHAPSSSTRSPSGCPRSTSTAT